MLFNRIRLLQNKNALCDARRMFSQNVPWFPSSVKDLDKFKIDTLDAGADLESDHPGFKDSVYRTRRQEIVNNASEFKFGKVIPRVQYRKDEIETWSMVYKSLEDLCDRYACKEFVNVMPLMKQHCGYAENNIPQLEDISLFLQKKTGFRLRPVSGLLTARDFLNALAFRTFFSTQYIRHSSTPLYTPEPDVCHELLGHVPMLADDNFADFSQHIGLASLGASDAEIEKLASCYWFSVEFGLLKENDQIKAYGAGLLSSFGELEYSCSGFAEGYEPAKYMPWEPSRACQQEYPITTYQPVYFVAESLESAKHKMKEYCQNVPRSFDVEYCNKTESVKVLKKAVPLSKSVSIEISS